jgi:hypothetical protein
MLVPEARTQGAFVSVLDTEATEDAASGREARLEGTVDVSAKPS